MTTGRAGVQLPVTPEKCVMLLSVYALRLISRTAVSSIICDRRLIIHEFSRLPSYSDNKLGAQLRSACDILSKALLNLA